MPRILQKPPPAGKHQPEGLHARNQSPAPESKLETPWPNQRWKIIETTSWRRGWWIAKVAARSLSFVLACALLGVELGIGKGYPPFQEISANFLVCVIVAAAVIAWDVFEFITLCLRRGYGIASKAHTGLDLTLASGALGAMILVSVYNSWDDLWFDHMPSIRPAEIALTALLFVIHLLLFTRNYIDHRHVRVTPRIMYLPTGEPVVVVPMPFPPQPSNQATVRDSEGRSRTMQLRPAQSDESPRGSLSDVDLERNAPSPPPQPYEDWRREPIASMPPAAVSVRRKPVPVRGTLFPDPLAAPGPDYVPDEAERERAARGEGQAQWVSTAGMEVVGKGTRPRDLVPRTPGA